MVQPNAVLDSVLDMLVTVSETHSEHGQIESASLLNELWILLGEGQISPNQLVKLIEVTDQITAPGQFLLEAVEFALTQEATEIARQLIRYGQTHFSENAALQKLERVLAPPKLLDANRPPRSDVRSSMVWLREHSTEYAGQWVALQNGMLLGTAVSRNTLLDQLGDHINPANILITWIPQ